MTREEAIIREAMANEGISNRDALAEKSGVNWQTLRRRMRRPETIMMWEFRAIVEATKMPDKMVLDFVRGGGHIAE